MKIDAIDLAPAQTVTAGELARHAAALEREPFALRFPGPWLVALGDARSHGSSGRFITVAESDRQSTPSDMRIGADATAWAVVKRTSTFPRKILVGRAPNNDVVLPYPSLSKLHAFFALESGRLTLTDAGSKNGTYVNDQPVPAAGGVAIEDHDVVRFGAAVRVAVLSAEALYDAARAGLVGARG